MAPDPDLPGPITPPPHPPAAEPRPLPSDVPSDVPSYVGVERGATALPDAGADPLGPLLRDMQRALRAEFGAQSIYALLPALTRDRELARLLRELRAQQKEHIELLRGAIESLGGRAPQSRWRRSVAAWALFASTPVLGLRFALRLCEEAAATVARWHAEYAMYLARAGRLEEARACQTISRQRLRQHYALRAWTENIGPSRPGAPGA